MPTPKKEKNILCFPWTACDTDKHTEASDIHSGSLRWAGQVASTVQRERSRWSNSVFASFSLLHIEFAKVYYVSSPTTLPIYITRTVVIPLHCPIALCYCSRLSLTAVVRLSRRAVWLERHGDAKDSTFDFPIYPPLPGSAVRVTRFFISLIIMALSSAIKSLRIYIYIFKHVARSGLGLASDDKIYRSFTWNTFPLAPTEMRRLTKAVIVACAVSYRCTYRQASARPSGP